MKAVAELLQGRVALVTGAGSGMGRTHCLELAAVGARVAVNDLDGAAAINTVEEIRERGGIAEAFAADVSNRVAVEAMVAGAARQLGGLDIVVCNAGNIHSGHRLAETTDAEWRATFAIHVDGTMFVCRAALPWLERSQGGRIIIISSMWGQTGAGHSHAYCAAKAAQLGFAKSLARELGPSGTCVNAVAPGGVHTRMTADMTAAELKSDYDAIPLHRYAAPEEISHLVAFLASDRAAFITGQTLAINGGHLIAGY